MQEYEELPLLRQKVEMIEKNCNAHIGLTEKLREILEPLRALPSLLEQNKALGVIAFLVVISPFIQKLIFR